MQMEYSADDIAAAKNLQSLTYLATSMVAFWTYDYACSLHTEWTFLLESRWTKAKGLYVITRHSPFFFLLTELYLHFTPSEKLDEYKCGISFTLHTSFSTISIGCSELFFVLRTYALWNNNRIVLAVMLSAFLAAVAACIVIGFITVGTSHVVTSAIPGITGCYRTSTNLSFIQFLLLFAFQLGLISLTLIRVIQSWRTNNGPLYAILVKHNIFYYASGLFLSAVNFLMLFYDSAYHSIIEDFECFVLAILATRMYLLLWQIDRDAHGSDALGMICLSDMFPADPMAYPASFVERNLD
ncbi:hypothetical protein DEU56DRAFT_594156 [Suillus clintonianus]|uniref:uncharacterized protein n=1 Tax=Suillus clintonianus TaxID=1904413 RepID=UPI001B8686A1|nr:uncharacterized protein DEU56DRAFT_594156 [Suillus clintonianus]KAG2124623.1 hypothetical protein DEU56DRAFT_594156 [Suillus clintonianus]